MQVGEKNFDFKKDYLLRYIFFLLLLCICFAIVFELWIYLQQSFGGREDHKLAMFEKTRMVTTLYKR